MIEKNITNDSRRTIDEMKKREKLEDDEKMPKTFRKK